MSAAPEIPGPPLPVEIVRGDGPVVLGMPHTGTWLPDDVAARLNERGRPLADTDWHIHRLYDGLLPGATTVRATFHRYVIDANRDPTGASLYPGQSTTGLCPTTDFDGRAIWQEGGEPCPDEIAARIEAFHRPYHRALAAEIDRVRQRHGTALLYDCHSIRSVVPFLFEGTLPVFSIGSNDGRACATTVRDAVSLICAQAEGYDFVVDGRFKGGWTTRHYGRPEAGVHAIQMELAQRAYMEEAPPWRCRDDEAERLRPVLRAILLRLEGLALSGVLDASGSS